MELGEFKNFIIFDRNRNVMGKFNVIVNKFLTYGYIFINERSYKRKLKYIWFRESSNSLLVIFPGFGKNWPRKYNYLNGLKTCKSFDRLYINDNFGFLGSYNLYENGSRNPEIITKELIDQIISKGKYKKLYFAGSSKGGSSAMYFGLVYNAIEIFAGACQYKIGSFLHNELNNGDLVMKTMMGNEMALDLQLSVLDAVIPNVLQEHKGSKSIFHIVYSQKDSVYEKHIVDLLNELKSCGYNYHSIEAQYDKHSEIVEHFLKFLQRRFCE